MRELARVERSNGFARFYHENGEIESICLTCFATVVPQGFQTLSEAERLHREICSKILKPSE
jgi:hypothetical protein